MKGPLRRIVVLVVLLACVLLACKRKESGAGAGPSSLGARAAKLKPDVQKRLSQVAALAPKVNAEPAVTTDAPIASNPSRASVAIVGHQYLADPNRSDINERPRFDNTLLGLCKYGTEQEPKTEDDVQRLEKCAALTTVAVIRSRGVERPKIKLKSKSFDPGKLQADVLVYELETGKLIATYDLLVMNGPKLELPGEGQSEDEWMGLAMADLEVVAQTKVEEKLGISL